MKPVYLFLILIALWTVGCAPSTTADGDAITLQSFKFSDLNGDPIDLEKLKGKRVFLNIWATWCGPCIQEMPSIATLQESLKNEPVAFLLASDEDHALINRFAARGVARDLPLVRLDNPEAFGINAIPVTFIFDDQGKLVHSEMGARDWSTADAKDLVLN